MWRKLLGFQLAKNINGRLKSQDPGGLPPLKELKKTSGINPDATRFLLHTKNRSKTKYEPVF